MRKIHVSSAQFIYSVLAEIVHTKWDRSSTPERETLAQSPMPNQEAIYSCYVLEEFSPMDCHCVYQPHFRQAPCPGTNTKQTPCFSVIVVCFVYVFCFWFFFGWFLDFVVVLFDFCLIDSSFFKFVFTLIFVAILPFLRERWKTWSWEGRGMGMIWEELGKGTKYNQNILYEKI